MLVPPPRPEDLASFYPPTYDFGSVLPQLNRFKRFLISLEYRLFFQSQYRADARRISRRLGPPRGQGQRLLDIGCGWGLRLLAFRRRGYDVHGADFQPEAIAALRQRGIPAVCADVAALACHFPPAHFDVITAFHVIEHVPDVRAVVGGCYQLLKPGGWMVAAVPAIDGLQAKLFKGRWAAAGEAPRHLSLPSYQGLTGVFSRLGFDQVILQPDTVFSCAAHVALSLCPRLATRHWGGGSPGRAVWSTIATSLMTAAAVPWCVVENYLCGRPSIVIVFARKPGP